jgi:hypothetical protein
LCAGSRRKYGKATASPSAVGDENMEKPQERVIEEEENGTTNNTKLLRPPEMG